MAIKVLVVDDSALMRKMIPKILSSDNDISVVGTAIDGDFALKKIPDLRPDVITLDIDMPRLDGLSTLKAIVRQYGIPVVLVSSLTQESAEITLEGLELGAFDFVPKPIEAVSMRIEEVAQELISKVKAAACSRPRVMLPKKNLSTEVKTMQFYPSLARAVAIGISTGGPQALAEILPQLPADFPYPVLIVQHMPVGFTGLLAKRLDAMCATEVKEADDGDVLRGGRVLIAPGGRHLKVKKTPYGAVAVLSSAGPMSGHKPSVNVLFNSVSEEFGTGSIGVLMTGMGDDGVEGLRAIKESGGLTIAQDEKSSVIFGMPKAAIKKGYADMVLSLEDIVPTLVRLAVSDGALKEV